MQALPFLRQPVFAIAVLSATACASQSSAAESAFSGMARAIDGDSLMVGEHEVRLLGIDAPEWDQTCMRAGTKWSCGQAAAAALSKLVTGKQIACTTVDTDEHGRTVARCTVGSVDVNRTMVALGYATAYRHYSLDYVSAEASAKANKRGLWSSNFQLPSDYRHQAEDQQPRRTMRSRPPQGRRVIRPQSATSAGSGCAIKGNRGSNGWIYHLPGMPFYDRTRAEQMFCSEAEAQAAGYRRAKVK